eukprot:SAG31_NODE_2888_length_4948_cov_2.055475_6_plen_117_part_00
MQTRTRAIGIMLTAYIGVRVCSNASACQDTTALIVVHTVSSLMSAVHLRVKTEQGVLTVCLRTLATVCLDLKGSAAKPMSTNAFRTPAFMELVLMKWMHFHALVRLVGQLPTATLA